MSLAIKVENLSKQYQLRHEKQQRYVALRDVVANKITTALRNIRNAPKKERLHPTTTRETFWALQDINLEINQGDRVGIIGRNGAGKSTLLKLLSRIVEPTSGRISINGRISSLLEVGTGFHPELTGRENIYLNGAILGMRSNEIRRKFDEIVAFADVERFLDTPVKHYSSGMYMRLAFSVAAHLDPEILVVDEVLAVGDAQFQKKCLGKMKEVGEEGRTILFVSHSMPTIASLCTQCVLLEHGRISKVGSPGDTIVHYYTSGGQSPSAIDYSNNEKIIGDEYVRLISASILNEENLPIVETSIRDKVKISLKFRVLKNTNLNFIPNFHFYTAAGICAFISGSRPLSLKAGDFNIDCEVPGDFLNEGTYFVGLAITSYELGQLVHFYEESALTFNVRDSLVDAVGRYGYVNEMPGVVRPHLEWTLRTI
jgi:lipopolysaccharide transport system ATP-binding protein